MPNGRGRMDQLVVTSRSSDSVPETPERPRSRQGGHCPQAQADTAGVPAQPADTAEASARETQIDMSERASRVLEGLRADAFLIARDIGLERLSKHDGIDHLIEVIQKHVFHDKGSELDNSEMDTVLSYIGRRKRWWITLRELDPMSLTISEPTRANLFLELSGLTKSEQLMIKAAAKEETVEEYARVLTRHHCGSISAKDFARIRRTRREGNGRKYPWYNSSQPRLPYASASPLTKARYGYRSSEHDYDGFPQDETWWNESDGWNG